MQRALVRAGWVGLLLTALFVGSGFVLFNISAAPVSETSSVSAAPAPTPTYVSELRPAVMLSPEQPAELPPSGARSAAASPWPKAAGLGLALLGGLLIHVALTRRPEGAR